jgi:hypothetical protein
MVRSPSSTAGHHTILTPCQQRAQSCTAQTALAELTRSLETLGPSGFKPHVERPCLTQIMLPGQDFVQSSPEGLGFGEEGVDRHSDGSTPDREKKKHRISFKLNNIEQQKKKKSGSYVHHMSADVQHHKTSTSLHGVGR